MKRGFSFVETIIALALLSTMIYMAATSFLSLSPKYKLKKAAGEVYMRLHFARYKAIFHGQPVRVRFQPNGYTVEQFDDGQKSWQPIVTVVLEGVTVEANNSPIFYPVGTVSNLATISIANSFGRYKLTLAISGRIRMIML